MIIPITRFESRIFNFIIQSFDEAQELSEFRVVDTSNGETLDIKISSKNNAADDIELLASFLKTKIGLSDGCHQEWSDENYPNEVVLKISELYFMHIHLPGDYIRFTEDRFTEILYWNSDEINEDPGNVWGAIFGALVKYQPAADSIEAINALSISDEQKGALILHTEINRLQDEFGNEHPEYTLNEWRRAVDDFETTSGYWHWLYSVLEFDKRNIEDSASRLILSGE